MQEGTVRNRKAIQSMDRIKKTQFRARARHAGTVMERRLRPSPPVPVSGCEADPAKRKISSASDRQRQAGPTKRVGGVTRGPEPRSRGLGCSPRRFEINLLFLAKRSKHGPAGDAAGILTGANMLSEVGDAIEVFAGSLVRCQRVWTLVPGEVLERSLIGFGDADHDNGVVMRGVN